MKKEYSRPTADKIEFCYKDQVTASGVSCSWAGTFAAAGCTDSGSYNFQEPN